jgi:hypothetical protein
VILHIDVTEADIADGVPEQCSRCPIALAMERAGRAAGIPPFGGHYAMAAPAGFTSWIGDRKTVGGLPRIALDWMERFDLTWTGKPFSFDLTLSE